MNLILDTHIWIRWLSAAQPLDERIVSTIEEAEYLAVSSVSCWEVAYLAKRQKLVLPLDIQAWMQRALEKSNVAVVDLTTEIAVASANLPDIHRDPADRFIMATALAQGCKLLSFDERFRLYDMIKDILIY